MDNKAFKITAYDKTFFCKVMTYGSRTNISIGSKIQKCMVVAINTTKPEIAYIARIETDEKCIDLDSNSTYKLVVGALWFVKIFGNSISPLLHMNKFTLIDDINIYCDKGSKQFKLPLSFDYISKYNQTWYEKKFNAILPEDMMIKYKDSLQILDLPLPPFEMMIDIANYLKPFENDYRESSTPRGFINLLRNKYDKDTYCHRVGPWLELFLSFSLQLRIYKESWEIPFENVYQPPNFSYIEIPFQDGGTRKGNTRKASKSKSKPYHFGPDYGHSGRCIGYYSEFCD